ncbi:MAG: hypothetical protein GWO00_20720, partial [Gemmatimonadetes bacterium]|nr:hypothetical protein [Gemmatimonadota bacterium]NIR80688.1 hypothetical protein [Gemmatimonadota bacterium]NIT89479.1 hypothetical protein [Gemmatimonadota bacterium]NIU33282.1 hypothetical protein [Gemmatimonadota bacterium]NIV63617.1 hypothetical protein [Gemmatimonadota bacterium]
MDAYELYLLGRHRWGQRSDPEALRGAVDYFQRAVEADPEFALAYSGLADAWVLTPLYERTADRLSSFARAREAARRALELSPTEPEVLATAGWVAYLADWDADRAGELLDRAVRLGPSYVWGVQWRSML